MATIDRSRDATQPLKHYAGVRMQQGRVLTDDDFNEAAALEAEDARRALIDVVGPYGSPDDGFKVSTEEDSEPTVSDGLVDLTLKAGTIYVGGCGSSWRRTSSYPSSRTSCSSAMRTGTRRDTSADLVYLEVWQQPVSAVEDGELFEEASGRGGHLPAPADHGAGADGRRGRHQLFGRMGRADGTAPGRLRGEWDAETAALTNDLRLIVDFGDTGDEEDLCAPEIAEGYLGARNTAIRVQLVDPTGTGSDAAFTWGYDNGAPLYRVSINTTNDPDRTTVTFLTKPKDQAHWPLLGQHVELVPLSAILDPNRELVGEGHGRCEEQVGGERLSVGHGHLATVVTGYEPPTETGTSGTVILDGHPPDAPENSTRWRPPTRGPRWTTMATPANFECYLRVWDRGTDISSDSRIGITPDGAAVPLGNTGITVQLTGEAHRRGRPLDHRRAA